MRHVWLIPHTVPSGDYRVKICEHSAPETCGNSDSFSIRSSKELRTADEDESEAFSPVQSPQGSFALNNVTSQKKPAEQLHDLPHELRREKRTERERLYFARMTEQIKLQQHGECTIERVHRPSKETFVERYMKPRKPAILTGMMDSWEAMKSWDFEGLGKRRECDSVL
ncbi:hypothetical protein OS493_004846 [Desmophyllum pertusum]|uniref:Uncharacterized protein n=1 Tax=Desmophyllum pertusum TaxID=174260 RepID=A0A9W9Z365_9CNID|nr:hypothetical protein OS493_004846 [Desmophyllum pertusum]